MRHKSFLGKYAPIYFFTLFLDNLLVAVCYNTVLAYILKEVTNAVIKKDGSKLTLAFILAIVSFLTAFLFEPVVSRLNKYCVKKVMSQLRKDSFLHTSKITVPAMEKMGLGEILTRVTVDVDTCENIYLNEIPGFVFALLFGTISVVLMFVENQILAVFSVMLGLGSVAVAKKLSSKIEEHASSYQKEMSHLTKEILDQEDGFQDIKMNVCEPYFLGRFQNINQALRTTFRKREQCTVNLLVSSNFFGNLNQIGLMVLGLVLALSGKVTVGGVLAILHLNGNASYLFQNFSTFLGGVKKSLPSVKRVQELLDLPIEEEKNEFTKQNQCEEQGMSSDKVLKVSNLEFSYPEASKKKVLDQICFSIQRGQFVSLEGESGGGKSTLLKILLGFYQENGKSVVLDGRKRDEVSLKEWRKKISYIPQNCYLYHMSIKENVRLGKLDATDEEIIEACKLAQAHDFILEQEKGYDTIIDTEKMNLSGGQCQRLAIARAFLRKASLLICDEATSALDPEMELRMKNVFETIKKDRGILFISHRKAVISDADLRLHLNAGRMSVKA